jgi:8-oxo-dGTP pyrophosphatase MutT (NUDIX family)
LSSRTHLSLDLVSTRLANARRLLSAFSPPDETADLALVADAAPGAITHRSAVLVALFEEDGETHLILTRRSFEMRVHRGEIALPGGRSHEDESLVETALREAHEEVGLDPSAVTPPSARAHRSGPSWGRSKVDRN